MAASAEMLPPQQSSAITGKARRRFKPIGNPLFVAL
jgi:hypothetical protein